MNQQTPSDRTDVSCRNCGQPAGPRFCGHCGQEVDEHRGPLLGLLREFFADWFSLDGRLVRTTAALLRPGRLTRRYLDGQRAPYLRPIRLYLVLSLLLFSSVLTLQTPDAEAVDIFIAGEWVNRPAESTGDSGTAPAAEPAADEVQRPDRPGRPGRPGRPQFSLLEPDTFLARYIRSRADDPLERLKALPPQEILDIVFAGLRRALPVTLVLFLPFLALALKLLYWRTGTLYVDHLIFASHFQSALFLALVLAWVITLPLGLTILFSFLVYALVSFLMSVIYLPLDLRRTYHQPWWLTAIKTVVLLYAYTRLMGVVLGGAVLWVIWRI